MSSVLLSVYSSIPVQTNINNDDELTYILETIRKGFLSSY